jgi:hypothetical protein
MSSTQILLGIMIVISGTFGLHNWKVASTAQANSGRRSRLCAEAKWRYPIALAFFLLAITLPVAAWIQKAH